jgi:hypothetical protein
VIKCAKDSGHYQRVRIIAGWYNSSCEGQSLVLPGIVVWFCRRCEAWCLDYQAVRACFSFSAFYGIKERIPVERR